MGKDFPPEIFRLVNSIINMGEDMEDDLADIFAFILDQGAQILNLSLGKGAVRKIMQYCVANLIVQKKAPSALLVGCLMQNARLLIF